MTEPLPPAAAFNPRVSNLPEFLQAGQQFSNVVRELVDEGETHTLV
jgi:hypothetical protein